jgi:hypothetical protein
MGLRLVDRSVSRGLAMDGLSWDDSSMLHVAFLPQSDWRGLPLTQQRPGSQRERRIMHARPQGLVLELAHCHFYPILLSKRGQEKTHIQ